MRAKWYASLIFVSFISVIAVLGARNINVAVSTSEAGSQVLAASTFVAPTDPLLTQINAYRSANGVPPLQENDALKAVTDVRVDEMKTHNYFAHTRSDGTDFSALLTLNNFGATYACENLQLQVGNNASTALEAWKNSPSHRRCLLDPRVRSAQVSYILYDSVDYAGTTVETYIYSFIATE
jgi:uncharacterized protein YkwD